MSKIYFQLYYYGGNIRNGRNNNNDNIKVKTFLTIHYNEGFLWIITSERNFYLAVLREKIFNNNYISVCMEIVCGVVG